MDMCFVSDYKCYTVNRKFVAFLFPTNPKESKKWMTLYGKVINIQKGHESDRFIRAWVTPHGQEVKLAIREKEIFSVPVGLQEQQWYHICPSWSSKTGHWDLFIDGKLKAHGFREKARGIVLPKHGDLVVGQEYTDFDKGLDDGIEGDIFGFNMVLSSTAPKAQSLSKVPFRFAQRRRISPLERRMDQGFIVTSPTLMLRRKSRKTEGEIHVGEENYVATTPNIQNRNVSFEDIVIETTPYDTSIEEYPSNINEEISYLSRRKRQSYFGTPISYSNFNFGPRPIHKPLETSFRRPSQYIVRQNYYPVSFMAPPSPPPPRKTSRIANDIIPFTSYNHKPLGLQLVELGFNCALGKGAPLKNVLVSWTKTPVRVFGGAILKKGDPFCTKSDLVLH